MNLGTVVVDGVDRTRVRCRYCGAILDARDGCVLREGDHPSERGSLDVPPLTVARSQLPHGMRFQWYRWRASILELPVKVIRRRARDEESDEGD